eukprot:11689834-Alexandrium_andersonii.AAC.1
MDTGGWVLTTHLVGLVGQNLDKKPQRDTGEPRNYDVFSSLAKHAACAFRMPEDVVALFVLTIE